MAEQHNVELWTPGGWVVVFSTAVFDAAKLRFQQLTAGNPAGTYRQVQVCNYQEGVV